MMQVILNAELPKKVKPLIPEYLSTDAEMNPLCLLEPFGEKPIIFCAVAVWTRGVMTGNLAEKGGWVRRFWKAAHKEFPQAVGCRLGWNTLFFAVLSQDTAKVNKQFTELLSSYQDECLTSFAVICKAEGTPEHKIDVLDALGHEIGSERSFGTSRSYQPNGYKFYHLLDGKPYIVK